MYRSAIIQRLFNCYVTGNFLTTDTVCMHMQAIKYTHVCVDNLSRSTINFVLPFSDFGLPYIKRARSPYSSLKYTCTLTQVCISTATYTVHHMYIFGTYSSLIIYSTHDSVIARVAFPSYCIFVGMLGCHDLHVQI